MKGIKCWRSSPGWQVLVHSSVWWWPHTPLLLHDVPCLFSSSLLSFPEDAGDIRAWDDLSVPRTVCGDWVNNKQPNRRSRPAGFSVYPPGYQASWEDLAFPLKHLLYGRRLQISFPVPCYVSEGLKQAGWSSPICPAADDLYIPALALFHPVKQHPLLKSMEFQEAKAGRRIRPPVSNSL